MKKRIYLPISMSLALFVIFWIAFLSIEIYAVVFGVINYGIRIDYILVLVIILFVLYFLISFIFRSMIHLNKKDIKVYNEFLPKFMRTQFKTSIEYVQIKSIKIIDSTRNSKNRYLRFSGRNTINKYLEFTLVNNRKKRILINFYRKNQIIKILTYISINMQYYANENIIVIDEIMKDWYVFLPNKKVKKQ